MHWWRRTQTPSPSLPSPNKAHKQGTLMLIIIGGSGMLLEASRSLTLDTTETVLLCGRRRERYASILQAATHSEFFEFDFSLACDYERLQAYLDMQSAGGQLPDDGADLTFLLWVHSPYMIRSPRCSPPWIGGYGECIWCVAQVHTPFVRCGRCPKRLSSLSLADTQAKIVGFGMMRFVSGFCSVSLTIVVRYALIIKCPNQTLQAPRKT